MLARFLIRIVKCSSSHSFIQLESDKTKLYIDWSGRSKRSDQLSPIILRIPRDHERGSIALNDKGKYNTGLFVVDLDLTRFHRSHVDARAYADGELRPATRVRSNSYPTLRSSKPCRNDLK